MSGGSYDYAFCKVEDMASSMCKAENCSSLRKAFAKHLRLVATAMKTIEWVDSGDCSEPVAEKEMRKVISSHREISTAIQDAESSIVALQCLIKKAKENNT